MLLPWENNSKQREGMEYQLGKEVGIGKTDVGRKERMREKHMLEKHAILYKGLYSSKAKKHLEPESKIKKSGV